MAKAKISKAITTAEFFSSLPAVPEKFDAALGALAAQSKNRLGMPLLKLAKDNGAWIVGQDGDVLDSNVHCAINAASFHAGYIAWHNGEIEAERMTSIFAAPVDASTLPSVKAKNGWQAQLSVMLKTLDRAALELVYKTTALGGIDALTQLAADIALARAENNKRVHPIVQLSNTSYKHKEYGKVYKPAFTIVGWLDAKGKRLD